MARLESVRLMEPMLPTPISERLQDLALTLSTDATRFAAQLQPEVRRSIGDLLRSMNCYYSNLIEGHDTHPRDIDRAMKNDFSSDPMQRDLQLEAVAHIRLQRKIDNEPQAFPIGSTEYIKWLHYEFCNQLPDDLLWVENPDTGEKIKVVPGELRTGDVAVGRHIPPKANSVPKFLARFEEAYDEGKLSKINRIVAVPASHHRLSWIHPFFDGNGRVIRLLSHAQLTAMDWGNLWSVSRGLARNVGEYKRCLEAADQSRQGDLDGRGSLSSQGLEQFCEFFLGVCIDQVSFMSSLVQPQKLLNRIEIYVSEQIAEKTLLRGSYGLLREAILLGKFERGEAERLTGYKDRQARSVLKQLLDAGLLVSDSERGPVRIGFPQSIVDRWFPGLYAI